VSARELCLRIGVGILVVAVLGAGSIAAIQIAEAEIDERAEEIENDIAAEEAAAEQRLQEAAIEMCERIKQDRIDNARGWTAVERLIADRIESPDTSPAERERSVEFHAAFGESANQLRSRLYQCEPLVLEGKQIIDERALREAQGDL
jgi:hypothetical protein